jgi:hypothetical protein
MNVLNSLLSVTLRGLDGELLLKQMLIAVE